MNTMPANLVKARAALVQSEPFFASLLLGMPMIEDASVQTLETDGESIAYNPEFVKTLAVSEMTFVLGHEVMHAVFEHMLHRGERDPLNWNIAADYVINDLLVKEKLGIMPQGALHDPALVVEGNGTTGGVYNLLAARKPKQQPKPQQKPGKPGKQGKQGQGPGQPQPGKPGQKPGQPQPGQQPGQGQPQPGQGQPKPGPGQPGGPLDWVKDSGKDPADQARKSAEMRVKVVQAANAAKMAGKLSAGMARVVGEATKSRVDWKRVLRQFFTERTKTDWSYARPKRRFLGEDIYLPSQIGEKMGEAVIFVDCSGSVDDILLALFGAEMRAICEDTKPSKVHVIYFDARVLHHDTYEGEELPEINPHGGGGTKFSPLWKYLDKEGINPMACVVLTDLECSDFGEDPGYPVLWATVGQEQAPFGNIVKVEE